MCFDCKTQVLIDFLCPFHDEHAKAIITTTIALLQELVIWTKIR